MWYVGTNGPSGKCSALWKVTGAKLSIAKSTCMVCREMGNLSGIGLVVVKEGIWVLGFHVNEKFKGKDAWLKITVRLKQKLGLE